MTGQHCDCGHPLWAPSSRETGQCEHCRLRGPAAPNSRTQPYRPDTGYDKLKGER